jgi:hypothetical protein
MDDNDNPGEMGGRDTDVSMLWYTLVDTIKRNFPVNGVPEGIAYKLNELRVHLDRSEALIEEIIEDVSEAIGARDE